METVHVVTCFIEHENHILLLKRSEQVGSYMQRWAGVSGYIEAANTPLEQAMTEIREELGLDDRDVAIIKEGKPLEVIDEQLAKKWIVHPFRFRVDKIEKISLDWEHSEFQWIKPQEISQYPTVPNLQETWNRVE